MGDESFFSLRWSLNEKDGHVVCVWCEMGPLHWSLMSVHEGESYGVWCCLLAPMGYLMRLVL